MRVAVTSTNIAKILAVENVFLKVFPKVSIIPVKTDSGVSTIPLNDIEAIRGCRNRINKIEKKHLEFIVSMEGLVQNYPYGTFIYGVAIIYDCQRKIESIGLSAKVQLPDEISALVSNHSELGDLIKKFYSSEKTKDIERIGSNGVITNGFFTRVDEFEGALKSALGYLMNVENYRCLNNEN